MTKNILTALQQIIQICVVVACATLVSESRMVTTHCNLVNYCTRSFGDTRNATALNDNPKIKLETKIITQEDVPVDNELRSVKIKLKLIFVNDGTESVLIYKGRTSVSHVWISSSEEKALAKEFEASISQTILYTSEKNINDLTKQDFVTLPKGRSYETEEIVTIFVRHDSSSGIQGSISKGEHFLQIYVETWAWTKEEGDKFQDKFTECGILIVTPIRSRPMKFVV